MPPPQREWITIESVTSEDDHGMLYIVNEIKIGAGGKKRERERDSFFF